MAVSEARPSGPPGRDQRPRPVARSTTSSRPTPVRMARPPSAVGANASGAPLGRGSVHRVRPVDAASPASSADGSPVTPAWVSSTARFCHLHRPAMSSPPTLDHIRCPSARRSPYTASSWAKTATDPTASGASCALGPVPSGAASGACQRTRPAVVTSRADACPGGPVHGKIGALLLQPTSPATAQAQAAAAEQARRTSNMPLGRRQPTAGPDSAVTKQSRRHWPAPTPAMTVFGPPVRAPNPNQSSPLPVSDGRLTQLGGGAVVSFPAPSDVVVVPLKIVTTATTRMSPAGMPFAFTVTEPPAEPPTDTLDRTLGCLPCSGAAGAGSAEMLGQPAPTGTTYTWPSPSWCSLALAAAIPDFW